MLTNDNVSMEARLQDLSCKYEASHSTSPDVAGLLEQLEAARHAAACSQQREEFLVKENAGLLETIQKVHFTPAALTLLHPSHLNEFTHMTFLKGERRCTAEGGRLVA